MHIAAAFPLALNESDLDPEIVERERAIATEKAAESGKPADIVAKMDEGAIAKRGAGACVEAACSQPGVFCSERHR